jgi:predicted nucleic acid-binding protein
MILLDTNVVSEIIRPQADHRVLAWFDRVAQLQLYISSITEAELWLGVYALAEGKKRANLESDVKITLSEDFADRILAFESRAALAYGKLFGKRRRLGRPIGHEDCAIAAIAQVHGMPIATRNIEDFEHCDVAIVNPWHG